ncbi:MAG: dienelactone hydrolase [Actinomycetota bacterium]
MTRDLLVFHHAMGVTLGVESFAQGIAGPRHTVRLADLFDGQTFASVEGGVAHAEGIGFGEIAEAGARWAAPYADGAVAIGLSLGALPAQKLAQSGAGLVGVVLCHSVVPVQAFGDGWPSSVSVQIHLGADDPWAAEDLDAAHDLAARSEGELHLYPTAAHLVTDDSHPDHDPAIAATIIERTRGFIAGL